MDGISRQRVTKESGNGSTNYTENFLQAASASLNTYGSLDTSSFHNMASLMTPHKNYYGESDEPELSEFFLDACKSKECALSFDREYNALLRRNTWTYVKADPKSIAVPFK